MKNVPFYAAAAACAVFFAGGYYTGKHPSSGGPGRGSRGSSSWSENPSVPYAVAGAASTAAVTSRAADAGSIPDLSPAEAKQCLLQALRQTNRLRRTKELSAALSALNERNAAAFLEGLDEHYRSGHLLSDESARIQERTGEVLGEKAMLAEKILPASPNGKLGYTPRQRMKGWASADPKAAKEWLENLEPGQVKEGLQGEWLAGLAQAAPEEIQSLFPTLPAHQQRGLVGGLLDGLQATGGLTAAREWYETNAAAADPGVAQEFFKGLIWRMGQSDTDWDASTALVKRAAAAGTLSDGYFNNFTRNMVSRAPGKCVELLADISAEVPSWAEKTDSLLAVIVDRSTADSLDNLGNWLNSNKGHPLYDRTAAQFAVRAKIDDPVSAARWAESIRDESLRTTTLENLQSN